MLKSLTQRLPWRAQKQTTRVEAMVIDMLDTTGGATRNYVQVVNEAYRRNSIVARSIRLIAQNAGSVKPLLYQRADDGDEEINQHPALKLLRRPNRRMAWRRFVETLVIHKKLSGRAFILALPRGKGLPLELHLLQPNLVEVQNDGRLGGHRTYVYRPSAGEAYTYTEDDVLYLSSIDPLNEDGAISDLEAVFADIDASNLAGAWNISLLRNSGRPSALVISRQALTPEQMQHLSAAKNAMFAGHANAGKIAVIDGQDIEWHELGMSAKDMEWLEGRKHVEAKIAIGIGVAPELVGLSEHKTFSNYEQAQKALWTETLIPELDYIYTELTEWLLPRLESDDLYLAPWLDEVAVLQDDKSEEAKRIDTLVKSNVITLGQAGADLGYEVREDLRDVYHWEVDQATRFGLTTPGQMPERTNPNPDDADEDEPKRHSVKMTEQEKTLHWKAVDTQRQAFEAVITERVRQRFTEELASITEATSAVSSVDNLEDAVNKALDAGQTAWTDLLAASILSAMEAFGENTLSGIKSRQPHVEVKDLAGMWGVYHQEALDYAERMAAEHVVSISETTKNKIRLIIQDGIEKGLSAKLIEAEIEKLYLTQIIPNRSEVIARTEVHHSSEAGSYLAAKGAELPMTKEWVTTRDGRERSEHASVDGQKRDLDEPFEVAGEELLYPGDSSLGASAGNTIQCRCTIVYSVT